MGEFYEGKDDWSGEWVNYAFTTKYLLNLT